MTRSTGAAPRERRADARVGPLSPDRRRPGPRRRRAARRPGHRHHRVLRLRRRRQDHDLGGPGAAGRRAGPQGRRAHHRPGPAAGAVDGHREARQHPAAGARASTATPASGSLDAMMLDMKRTFDEVVESQASPEKAAQILANPFYVALSSSFAGTQEYMAMEKLGQLHADARRDRPLGPDRGRHPAVTVGAGLPGRPGAALELPRRPVHPAAAGPGPGPGPADDGRASSVVTNALTKVLGAQVLRDMQTFVAAFDTLFGGFRQRAQKTYAAAPGRRYGVPGGRRTRAGRAARGGVLRRAAQRGADAARRPGGQPGQPATRRAAVGASEALAAAERLDEDGADGPTAGLLRLHADRTRIVARETRLRARFATAHPDVPTAVVPALSDRRARPRRPSRWSAICSPGRPDRACRSERPTPGAAAPRLRPGRAPAVAAALAVADVVVAWRSRAADARR